MDAPSSRSIGHALLASVIGFLTLHGGFSLFRPTPARETLVVWSVIVGLILAMLGFVSLRRKRGARLH
jgi:LPXTG-motif cell wall-anchored protein